LKRFVLGVVIVLMLFFVYEYQKPIITSDTIVRKAIECINHPPESLHIKYSSPPKVTLKGVQSWKTDLDDKGGFFNNLTNKREWRVTLIINETDTTVKMNAYNGKCLGIYGPLN
jgi:hypothetical protein